MRSFLLPVILLSTQVAALRVYCSSGDPCWPTAQEWSKFNSSIPGRLIAPRPPAVVCHDPAYDTSACPSAQSNWTTGHWRADQPGAYQETNWENGDARCFVDTPRTDVCEQGRVPVLAVAAESVSDIQKAVKFAAKKSLHLVVKNTGHDYLGRSSGVGSFAIWTHKMKGIKFSDSFRPDGCPKSAAGVPAVTVKAGEQWLDVYRAAHARGVVVVGGNARSVGAAGGYVLGGGHSPISHLHGMAIDNVLQFTIVTANGEHVTANTYTNKDLFWALRGGGGSNWGVVTSVTYKTHPAFKNFLFGQLSFMTNDAQTAFEFNKRFFELIPSMVDAGFSSFPAMASNFTSIALFQANSPSDPGHTGDYSIANATFAPLFELVASLPPGVASLTANWTMFNSWFEFFEPTIGDISVGTNVWIGGRIITRDVLINQSAALTKACMAIGQFGAVTINVVGGGAVHKVKVGETPLHPAWRVGGLASLNVGTGWPNGIDPSIKQLLQTAVTNITQSLDTIIGDNLGAYFNEADPLEPKWKQVFWGSNYDRLLSIKRKVDPWGVFTCNRCVGSDL